MLKVLLIEDEIPARKKLRRFLEALDTPLEIVGEIDQVAEAILYLNTNKVDLIFSDIALLDGNAFEIYSQVNISCPIIFTTAYDQFWMDAFESNGIAYLLKPFSQERFQKAWDKFIILRNADPDKQEWLDNMATLLKKHLPENIYKQRFTINSRQGLYFLNASDIVFFEAQDGLVSAYDANGKRHPLTVATLKEMEDQVNPNDFFRINRAVLLNKQHIERIERYTKNTLAAKVKGYDVLLKTSQSATAAFREWIDR